MRMLDTRPRTDTVTFWSSPDPEGMVQIKRRKEKLPGEAIEQVLLFTVTLVELTPAPKE